jgi:multidrug efflux pump
MNQVIAQIGAQNAVEGAGVLNAGTENLQVRVGGQFNSVEELERLPIRAVNPPPAWPACAGRHRRDPPRLRDPPAVKVRHQGRR